MQCMKKRMDFIDNYSSLHGPFHSFCPQGFLRRIMYRCCRLNKLKSPSPIVTSRKQPRKCNNFNHMHRVSIVKTFMATCSSLEKVQITDMLHVIYVYMYMYVLLSVKTSKLSTQFTELKFNYFLRAERRVGESTTNFKLHVMTCGITVKIEKE